MATTTVTTLVDDIDGGTADHTVELVIDGEAFVLDLSTSHRNEMVRSLARWMAVARRVGGDGAPTPTYVETKADPRTVREWARARGIDLPQGRPVPKDVVEQFRAAGN